MAIKVIENVRVKPSLTDEYSLNSFNLPLTFFELRYTKYLPNQRVIFYRLTESSSKTFNSHILPKLKHSLSHVLRYYLPLAGRLTWDPKDPKPSIIASPHDTVALTVAETDADFSFLSSYGPRPTYMFHHLAPELEYSDDSATLLSVQITLFPNQGFCIGIAAHHSVNDAATSAMFIKSWAHICKLQQHSNPMEFPLLPEDLTPSFDRTVVNVPSGLEPKMIEFMYSLSKDPDNFKSLKPPPRDEVSTDVVRVSLELTLENVKKLRERVKNGLTRPHHELHLSTFVIAYAYAWTCLVKMRGGDANRPVRIIYAADLRARLDPPLPATYFGCCMLPIGWFDYEARTFLKEDGFVNAAEILSDSVKVLGSRGIESLFEDFVERWKKVIPGAQEGIVTGSTRLGVYGSDFGWGRPAKTEFISIDRYAAFSMTDSRDESGGVEIGLCLKKSEMNTFVSLFKNGLSD